MTKHSVGIIVDDNSSSSKQTYDFIALSRGAKNYEVTHLIVNNTSPYTGSIITRSMQYIRRRGAKKFISNAAFKVLCNFESIFVKRWRKFSNFFDKCDLAEFDLEIVKVNPVISKSGLLYRYNEEDIDKIKSLNLNLLVRGGGGIMRGEILSVCENGIISFHHADNDVNRGGPPGFWETKNKEPRTGFVIQRLKDELDGGDVLFKGFVPTYWIYTITLANLFEISTSFLHYVIEDVTSESPRLSVYDKKPYAFPLYTTPTLSEQTSYILSTLATLVARLYHNFLGKSYRWGVAYQLVDDWRDVTLWRSKRIPNPPNRFLADPFVVKKNGVEI